MLKVLKLSMPAKYDAILEGFDERTVIKSIKEGRHPFGKVYGKRMYRVATIPLLQHLGITEMEAVEILRANGIEI